MEYDAQCPDIDFTRKHTQDLERIRNFRLMDDDFMSKVFEDTACAEFLLQIILNRDDLKVQSALGQYDLKNLQGRSVRLDILAVDTDNRVYNIEIQRNDHGASAQRARYNRSMLDANISFPGEDFSQLNETYVIFITENDVLGADLPIYHVDSIIRETGTDFGDGAHIIYVNAQIKDGTKLGRLMQDFSCKDSSGMHYKILADRVHYFKHDEKGVAMMCRAMEEMRKEAAEEAARVAEYNTKVESAKRMLADHVPSELVAKYTALPLEEIQALAQKVSA